MKEPTLLMPMQWVVSGVEIENDLTGRWRPCFEAQFNEKPPNPSGSW
jgi:hypothetical protein